MLSPFARSRTIALAAILLSIATAAAGMSATAATITWGAAQNISGDSDVSTTGTLLYAYNFGPTTVASTTINGVTFAPFALPTTTNPPGVITVGSVSISEDPGQLYGDYVYGSSTAPFSNLSADYKTLLSTGATAGLPGTITLQLGGLTINQVYDFQWWSNNSTEYDNWSQTIATAGNSVTLITNTSGTSAPLAPGIDGGTGQYAIGTFTADTTTQAITFNADPLTSYFPLINGFQVRAVSPSAIPEIDLAGMGSVLALVTGALGLVERRWARRQP